MVLWDTVVEFEQALLGDKRAEVDVVHKQLHEAHLVLYESGQENVGQLLVLLTADDCISVT